MVSKYEMVSALSKYTTEQVTKNAEEWTKYLQTAARLYRYPFQEQVLIYAQRPKAEAVASIDIWNKRMNCWVNKGAKGIALIDENRKGKLKYVFDMNDVHKAKNIGRLPNLWELKEEHKDAVIKHLESIYGATDDKYSFEERLIEIAGHIAEDYTPDILSELTDCQEDSYLSGLDEFNVEVRLRETLSASIAYTLLSRCGADVDMYVDELNFEYITEFNTLETVSVLGEATSHMCEPVLMDICRTVESIDRQKEREQIRSAMDEALVQSEIARGNIAPIQKEKPPNEHFSEDGKKVEIPLENHITQYYNALKRESETQNNELGGREHGADIQTGRGLSDTESGDGPGAGGSTYKVRDAERNISEGTPSGDLHRETVIRDTDGALSDDTEAGGGESRQTDRADDEERGSDREPQSRESDGVGSQNEFHQEPGGRDSSFGDSLQPLIDIQYEQLSFFPSMAEQIGTIEAAEAGRKVNVPAAFSLDKKDIEEILKTGGGRDNSRMRIYEKYREGKSPEDMAEFLKNEYKVCGKGFEIGGHEISVWFDDAGMKLGYGRQAKEEPFMQMSWKEVEGVVSDLVKNGDYIDVNGAFLAEQVVRGELSSNVYFFFRDSLGEVPESLKLEHGNFADMTTDYAEMLSTKEGTLAIADEIGKAIELRDAGEIEFRFRLKPSPEELYERLTDFAQPKTDFPNKDRVEVMQESFITQDEIDSVLTRGSGFEKGKFRITECFQEGHDSKDTAAFLKKEYGTGGSTHAIVGKDHSYQDHDAKGIKISKGNIMNPLDKVVLNWNVVEKRLGELIFEGKYLTPKEQENYEKWQLEKAQKTLGQVVQKSEVDDAIEMINDFMWEEYDHEGDFSDISNIELAYTDYLDEKTGVEHQISVVADLEEYSIKTYVDDALADTEKYESLAGLMEYELQYLNFDSLVSIPDDVLEQIEKGEIGQSDNIEETLGQVVQKLEPEAQEDIQKQEIPQPVIDKTNAKNFHLTDENLGIGTAKEKYARNVEAIRTLNAIESENRMATPKEQEILSKYVGWGGLADAFDDTKSNWSAEYSELKELLTPEEYSSARESTLNAHYTSPAIIEGIYDTLGRMGFEKGNILEPSMGVGNFFGMLPENMQQSRLYGVELDSLTGRIAKQLYPKADVQIKGFEETRFPNDFFDVAVGNVPFGQYKVNDKEFDKQNFLIHDYFFAKTLDKVRPGGVIAFVTSKGTLDKQGESVRKYLAERAEFLGAVRLPNTAFKENAGTEVTSDIIFLKKRDRLVKDEPEWIHTSKDENDISMNSYFVTHPEQIVGHMEMVTGPYGMESTCKADTDIPFKEQLKKALSNVEGSIDMAELSVDELGAEAEDRILPADPNVKNFSYTVVDNEVYYRENSIMKPVDVAESKSERIKGMVALRDCTRELIDLQMNDSSDTQIKEKQQELNGLYDKFEKNFGRINSRSNKSAFDQDSSYSLLCSLETFDSDGNFKAKADMFSKRTIKKAEPVTSVDTASEALAVSLSEKAKVDLPFMSELSNKSEQEVIEDLAGVIFKDPIKEEWQTADEYLSGNVREKLKVAEEMASANPDYAINVKAFQNVMPKDLDASEIEVRLGATWIDPKYIEDFMKETLQTPGYLTRSYGYSPSTNVI